MKLTNKSLKLAGALAVAMIGVSPIALSTAASAAPVKVITHPNGATHIVAKPGSRITTNQNGVTKVTENHSITRIATNNRGVTTVTVRKVAPPPPDHFRFGYDDRRYGDRFHKPPARFEHASARPVFAKFWQAGHWNYQLGHWMWIGGTWMR